MPLKTDESKATLPLPRAARVKRRDLELPTFRALHHGAAMDCDDAEEARDLLRHKSSNVTRAIYRAHFDDRRREALRDRMESAVDPSRRPRPPNRAGERRRRIAGAHRQARWASVVARLTACRRILSPQMHPTAARLVERLRRRDIDIEVVTLDDSARTAALAAQALGVETGQIVKSLVFLRDDAPVMVLCAGDRRVDAERLGLRAAPAERVREITGFSIGGIPPFGHDVDLPTMLDESLRRFEVVWAAAGTPHDVFGIRSEALVQAIPGAVVTDVS